MMGPKLYVAHDGGHLVGHVGRAPWARSSSLGARCACRPRAGARPSPSRRAPAPRAPRAGPRAPTGRSSPHALGSSGSPTTNFRTSARNASRGTRAPRARGRRAARWRSSSARRCRRRRRPGRPRRRGCVDVVGHCRRGRILAAQLELQLHEARGDGLRDLLARGVAAREEERVDGLLEQRAAHLAAADDRREQIGGQPGLDEQLADGGARHRGQLGRLVEDGVAREQRRHEHVRAHEVGIVPGRDVGDDAEGLVRDELLHVGRGRVAGGQHDLLAQRRARALEEEVQAARRHGVENSLRACATGLPISRVSVSASSSRRAASSSLKRRTTSRRSPSGVRAHAGCARRARV